MRSRSRSISNWRTSTASRGIGEKRKSSARRSAPAAGACCQRWPRARRRRSFGKFVRSRIHPAGESCRAATSATSCRLARHRGYYPPAISARYAAGFHLATAITVTFLADAGAAQVSVTPIIAEVDDPAGGEEGATSGGALRRGRTRTSFPPPMAGAAHPAAARKAASMSRGELDVGRKVWPAKLEATVAFDERRDGPPRRARCPHGGRTRTAIHRRGPVETGLSIVPTRRDPARSARSPPSR